MSRDKGAFLLAAAVLSAASASRADQAPNIILICADDLGWADVGFNGRREWKTPHIDRLASQGTRFSRFYVASVVCAPSRAALLTGRQGIHNGVTANGDDLPREEVTLAEALRARGYATALFGKWHQGQPRPGEAGFVHPLDQGFEEFAGLFSREVQQKFPAEIWVGRERRPATGYADTIYTDHALGFLARHRSGPFFLYLPYVSPHFKIEAPTDDLALFRGRFAESDPREPLNASYAAMVTRLDKEVGRLLAALDEHGMAARTLVVFTSDNGATFEGGNRGTSAFHDSNRPFRGQKRTLWEGGMRVPGVARWPGRIPAGRVSDAVVHMTDLFPTFLAAAGIQDEPARPLDGRNLLAVWQGREPRASRTLFWEWRGEGDFQLAAMRDDFKLVITGNQKPELFDLRRDEGERRNLVKDHAELARELEAALRAWLATESDSSREARAAAQAAAPPREQR